MVVAAPVVGGLVGAGLMYVLDRDSGRRRRGLLRDKAIHTTKELRNAVNAGLKDLEHRTQGRIAEARAALRSATVDDELLVERVRACMGHVVSHSHGLKVEAQDGHVTLSGPVLPEEARAVLSEVRRVRGVKSVEDRLEIHCNPERVPALQGESTTSAARFRKAWRPGTRLIAGTAAGVLTGSGLVTRSPLLTAGGLVLLGRVMLNRPVRRMLGFGAQRRLFELQKTLLIEAPVRRVYEYLSDLENLPRFLSHVKSVRPGPDGRSHWTLEGPAGISLQWDAITTRDEPNECLAWKTVPGALVKHAGIFRFEPVEDGTRVHLTMSWNPPGGVIGQALAKILGSDPKRMLDDDLRRLKTLLEVGRTTAHGRTAIAPEVTGL